MNELIDRLNTNGWEEKAPIYDLDNREITYFFVKGRWVCEITDRPYHVEFYKLA